ncbi:MAG: MBL fold metallo-hydrolase [Candidatus Eremiobacteraeota bacterium]|nr:MBL fold metallo-hydrolase [Candidatus Eremiobacteraeota bacterium]
MQTSVTEIADRIYRISSYIPEAGPGGFTFNQFLIDAEEPLIFHTGLRNTFAAVSDAIATIIPLNRLRWITFGHFEADECGAMNQFLAAAPHAVVAHGQVGVMVSVMDQADRTPRALQDGELLDLGGKRVRRIDTPHVPHGWDAGLLFEETTGTLLAGDLFTRGGNYPALTQSDIVEEAIAVETHMPYSAITPRTAPTIRALADLAPKRLALMHNSTYTGDCAAALRDLATWYDASLAPVAAG